MEGMIGWILMVPGLYFLLFGRIYTPRGIFEIPSDQFYVRLAGLTFILAGLMGHLALKFILIGLIVAHILLIVAIVVAVRDLKPRPEDDR
jgi:hypothetical protein